MAHLTSRICSRTRTITRPANVRVIRASFRTVAIVRSHDNHGHDHKDHATHAEKDERKEPSIEAMNQPLPADLRELNQRFDEIFKIAGGDEDRGVERYERLYRAKMHRVPRYQGDFSSLEENHILYGDMGTPDSPVLVESVYTSRIVGCAGSQQTRVHDILWHVVKREKPLVCLECGQTFQLITPPGETILPLVAAHH